MNIKKVYQQLLKQHGPQGWWPVFVRSGRTMPGKPLKVEFRLSYGVPYAKLKNCRTKFRDPYFEIALGAMLTQNTAWKNAAGAIINLYNAKALTPKRLLKLPTAKLQKLIKPAGYFRQKAKKLRLFASWIIREFDGDILNLKKYAIGDMRYKLLEQWGIGPETADSILLYALDKPVFVVDEYSRRLCKKYEIIYKDYDDYRDFFERQLRVIQRSHQRLSALYQEYHALIVAWGKNNF